MGANILIVEDEEPLTTLLRYNLEAEGYEVDAVARGDEADTRLRETAPDLIVLDWMLPGLSGIELCRRLRTRPQTAVAADHHADRARRGKRAGARACHRRRRLHRQAVLGAGTVGAHSRVAAPGQSRAGRHGAWRSAISSSIARKSAYRVQAARSISDRRSFACSNF